MAGSSSGGCGDICSIGGKATDKWAPRVSNKAAASTSSTKTSKSKNRSRSLAKAGASAATTGTSTPVPASAAKSTPSLVSTTERGLGCDKGKRGPAKRATPAVKDEPFTPNDWGPQDDSGGYGVVKGGSGGDESPE